MTSHCCLRPARNACKSGILAEIFQIIIPLEQWVAWKAALGRGFQPFDCIAAFIHKCKSASDVISRVVKVSEAFSF